MKATGVLTLLGGIFSLICVGLLITGFTVKTNDDGYYILVGLGLVFWALGSSLAIFPRAMKKRRQFILQNGRPLQAKVIEIRKNMSVYVNGMNTWVIVAEFRDMHSSRIETAISHNLWTDPTNAYPRGSSVTIYYLPDRPSRRAFKLEKVSDE